MGVSDVGFDAAMLFWRIVLAIFFREIRPRGAYNIPRTGPVIFVGAPHHNQACTPYFVIVYLAKTSSFSVPRLEPQLGSVQRIQSTCTIPGGSEEHAKEVYWVLL